MEREPEYPPLFEVREAMSHTAVFNGIASVVVRFVCDHDLDYWTMDKHYNNNQCKSLRCGCCFAQTKNGYKPQNRFACEMCSDAWRLSTVSRFLRYVAIEHGKAQPRWWIWSPMSLPLSSFVDGGYKPQDGGQPEIEADDTSEHWSYKPQWYGWYYHSSELERLGQPDDRPVRAVYPPYDRPDLGNDDDPVYGAGAKKVHYGYEPQWKWEQERWVETGWSSSSVSELMWQPDDRRFRAVMPPYDRPDLGNDDDPVYGGGAKKVHYGYKPQWTWERDCWVRRSETGWSLTWGQPAAEWLGEPDVICHGEPWLHLGSKDKCVGTETVTREKCVGTETVTREKSVGTDDVPTMHRRRATMPTTTDNEQGPLDDKGY